MERSLWRFVAFAAAGVGLAGAGLVVMRVAFGDGLTDVWVYGGLVASVVGLAGLYGAVAQVRADAYGVHSRTLLRRRSVPWSDIADLCVHVQNGRHGQEIHRVGMLMRAGRARLLPLPASVSPDDRPGFDATLDALSARCTAATGRRSRTTYPSSRTGPPGAARPCR